MQDSRHYMTQEAKNYLNISLFQFLLSGVLKFLLRWFNRSVSKIVLNMAAVMF